MRSQDSCPLFGQQFATINVTVFDPSGGAVAQAKISVRNIDDGVVRNGDSGKTGTKAIPGFPADQYTLTVNADSFATYEQRVVLTLGQVADVQVPVRIPTATQQSADLLHSTPGIHI